MASPSRAPIRTPTLQPSDWVRAGFLRLAQDGIEAVRVEVLARDLGVSKGSFYWHFRDREELVTSMLTNWEDREIAWLEQVGNSEQSAATRWAQFVERYSNSESIRVEAGLRSWARRDERVANHVTALERKRSSYVSKVLQEVGFSSRSAEEWSEIAMLVWLGWLDRATRDPEFKLAGRGLGGYLSELVLAASTRIPGANR